MITKIISAEIVTYNFIMKSVIKPIYIYSVVRPSFHIVCSTAKPGHSALFSVYSSLLQPTWSPCPLIKTYFLSFGTKWFVSLHVYVRLKFFQIIWTLIIIFSDLSWTWFKQFGINAWSLLCSGLSINIFTDIWLID